MAGAAVKTSKPLLSLKMPEGKCHGAAALCLNMAEQREKGSEGGNAGPPPLPPPSCERDEGEDFCGAFTPALSPPFSCKSNRK